jgi:cytochrome c biogenesis protein
VKSSDLTPLCIDLDQFTAKYEQNLTAASFTADIRYGAPGKDGVPTTIGVNEPLRVDGDRVYVTGHGYSPTFSVTTADGKKYDGLSVPFLPTNTQTMASEGALKLPDVGTAGDDQLALQGFFAPTGVVQNKILTSIDPRPLDPQVAIFIYQGYLGLDSGVPQSVYSLDREQIDRGQLKKVAAANLTLGQSTTLTDGTTIAFTGYKEFASLQLSHDPGQLWVLGAAISLLLGLLGMLLLRRERVFARVAADPRRGGTVLTLASLTRGSGESAPRFTALKDDLADALADRAPRTPPGGQTT